MSADKTAVDLLAHLIRVMDALEERETPAVTLVCLCGSELPIWRRVPQNERRQLTGHFQGAHQRCAVTGDTGGNDD
jgi:hypothetical protein